MLIQRKIHFDVPNGHDNIYWEDINTKAEILGTILVYLKSLNHPVDTEYRIIHDSKHSIARICQSPTPKTEIRIVEN